MFMHKKFLILLFSLSLWAGAVQKSETLLIRSSTLEKAKELIDEAFIKSSEKLSSLIKSIESELDLRRKEWSIHILREFADKLLEITYTELKSPRQESRWLNLCGFCLRPGFGDPADGLRLKKIWKQMMGKSLWSAKNTMKTCSCTAGKSTIFTRLTNKGYSRWRTLRYNKLTKINRSCRTKLGIWKVQY